MEASRFLRNSFALAAGMTIAAGTRLGRYEVRSKIGAGGMGEVYLAEDTQLCRRVALKILPAAFSLDRERTRRFEQEAKSTAALNHPNIATIHEIGEHDGTHYIAMEFIDGVTLREKIHEEQAELGKVLRFLQHAAEGLAQAHTAGIVHRDLKPENIMVTRDGHAKILDFGLAKLLAQPPVPDGDSSEAVTVAIPQHSIPGTILGTLGYMSPEQAQGKTKEVDHRSDIFSFGCILFEAITGKKPFEAETVVKSLHMVIYESPPSLAELSPSAPVDLRRVVRRCLAKDPEERYQTIKDVVIELRELRRELQGSAIDPTAIPPGNSETGRATEGQREPSQDFDTPTDSTSLSTRTDRALYGASWMRQHKAAVAISLAALVAGILAIATYLRWWKTNAPIQSIAVMPFVNEGGSSDVDYLSDGMTETLIKSLSQLPNLAVKSRSTVFHYRNKETSPKRIGEELNVQAVLLGRVGGRGDDLKLSLELVNTQTQNVVWAEQYDRKQSDLVSLQRK